MVFGATVTAPKTDVTARRLACQITAAKPFNGWQDTGLVTQFQNEARLRCQFAKRAENSMPADIPLANVPVPVGIAVGILQVDVLQRVSGAAHEIINRRRTR